jgi:hypothetical protein
MIQTNREVVYEIKNMTFDELVQLRRDTNKEPLFIAKSIVDDATYYWKELIINTATEEERRELCKVFDLQITSHVKNKENVVYKLIVEEELPTEKIGEKEDL